MTSTGGGGDWTLVVPLKPLTRAKSRLSASVGEAARARLALAFAQDTVHAAMRCPRVRTVVVVTDDVRAGRVLTGLGAGVVPDVAGGGLNAALRHGVARARAERVAGAVAALNADLPALRPAELSRVLAAAAAVPRAFLPDAAGTGTTLLAAGAEVALRPAFGWQSRRRHLASGAVELSPPDVPGVRQDVDTGEDLLAALELGVGTHTLGVLDRLDDFDAFRGAARGIVEDAVEDAAEDAVRASGVSPA
ncbi:2-phospho-L-lactate guanylyltransferase [Streptomyces durbertensis]|uniref:Phosphoenolpyruvate guanylyltransferase n=2 Tax=Streptomyces durbertensis TaxID=2448886 RepID=A0ABR6EJB4_9ACTN|nr:2-phospho-L-lactate guanylyltransferase [Streptomyces durbertensis]